MNYSSKKGYVTVAMGSEYVKCATLLASSLKKTQKDINHITLITNSNDVNEKYFDNIIKIDDTKPWNVISNLINYTPYDETLYIESDMLVTQNLDNWWTSFDKKQMAVTQQVRDHKNSIYTGKLYRRFFLENNLPNIYSGIFCFKKDNTTKLIFDIWNHFTTNWDTLKNDFKFNIYNELPADEGLAIAIRNSGEMNQIINPNYCYPSFIHCKPDVLNIVTSEWINQLSLNITEEFEFKLGYHNVLWPIHYQIKDIPNLDIVKVLE